MKKIYINFRKAHYNKWQGEYAPSYVLDEQFSDYAWIIAIKDNIIPDNRYTKVNANWLKNKTKFWYYEFDEAVDQTALIDSINLVASYNAITIIPTVEEARQDVRDRTDLKEIEEWKFEIYPAWTDEEWKPFEAKYLIID